MRAQEVIDDLYGRGLIDRKMWSDSFAELSKVGIDAEDCACIIKSCRIIAEKAQAE